jgi:predicted phosphodiesterase
MKKLILILICLFPALLIAQTRSIYDIQYTIVAGDEGYYPSTYNEQTVNTGGIVTAINYLSGQFFISSSHGGAWNGIFIYDNNYTPSVGDSIIITGLVADYQGYTEIKNLSSYTKVSSGNAVPSAVKIATNEVGNEAYEGVLVELNNCNASTEFSSIATWNVNDGSGDCEIRTGMYNLKDDGFSLIINYPFKSIKGVIGINGWSKSIHPRFIEDIQSDDNALIVSTSDKSVDNNSSIELPVKISILNQSEAITAYSLKMQYDASVFEYTGFSKTGTISHSGIISDASTSGNIELNFTGSFLCDIIETLVNLNFTPLVYGNANLQFNGTTINGSAVPYALAGDLEYASSECSIPIGDTLTIVQRPVLNIPSIVVPGQELNLICFAPSSTTSWVAELVYDDVSVPLNVTQSSYDTGLERWTITTAIPNVDLYELYDLRVTASDGISDDVTNAVKVIDQYKEDYYFVHITDTHLPGHTFYGGAGYETDATELDDLYEVIKDINLIHPEFVLLTGDLINEGELEDFECLRNHTLTVELLEKFEVPVYIVPGNHDLGGWDATPPPQGTARQEWWRFFGWRQRELPPTETEYLTHDYSFDYGNVHYVGLEAYDNYDSYMYGVYGDESFIPAQISWLQNNLSNAGDATKVLFYHYDFKHELDLSSLGVDMALWGHTHNDAEDATHPYDISTASVCDGNKAFRVIRVNGSNVQAESSTRTHSDGDMLTITFNTSNDGSLDNVSATINNKYNQQFENGLIKFVMPVSDYGYNVTNGRLMQVLVDGSTTICYVEVTIPSSNQITINVEKKISNNITSIYDIQHTTNAGDGTYPSPLNGQTVTTGGIVTAINYLDGCYFISSSEGGAWNNVFIYDINYSPNLGDSILLTGTVKEYNGYTEIAELTSFEVKSTGNVIPPAINISSNDVVSEAYEGALVEINNCVASNVFDEYGNWTVNDGSGNAEIKIGIYNLKNDNFMLFQDYPFNFIKGVVAYYYGSISIQPRSIDDIQSGTDADILISEDKVVEEMVEVEIPIKMSLLSNNKSISSYSLKMDYNSTTFKFNGFDKTETISESGSISDNSSEGNIKLDYSGSFSCDNFETLVKLRLIPLATGDANLQFNGSTINGSNVTYTSAGKLEYTGSSTNITNANASLVVQNYPNPFSAVTSIYYELTQKAKVNISVYNMLGQLVKVLIDELKSPGDYSVNWDATNTSGNYVENGIYLYKYNVNGNIVDSGQMVYLK